MPEPKTYTWDEIQRPMWKEGCVFEEIEGEFRVKVDYDEITFTIKEDLRGHYAAK